MNRRQIIVIIMFLVLLTLGGALIYFALFQTDESTAPSDTSADVPAQCRKFGANYALGVGNLLSIGIDEPVIRSASLGMGYQLLTVEGSDEISLTGTSQYINEGLRYGVKTILRICSSGGNCAFQDPNVFVDFARQLRDRTNGEFFVLAGPNEPITEDSWLVGTQPGDPTGSAPATARYMNSIINGVIDLRNQDQRYNDIKLLSFSFNGTRPDFSNFVAALRDNEAQFNLLDGIAINIYNSNNGRISDFLNTAKTVFGPDEKPFYITETGMIEVRNAGVPKTTAIENFINEANALRDDNQVEAFLWFAAFGYNTGDENESFEYNQISDEQYLRIANSGNQICNINDPNPSQEPIPTDSDEVTCEDLRPVFIVNGQLLAGTGELLRINIDEFLSLQLSVTASNGNSFGDFDGNLYLQTPDNSEVEISGAEESFGVDPPYQVGEYTLTPALSASELCEEQSASVIVTGQSPTPSPTDQPETTTEPSSTPTPSQTPVVVTSIVSPSPTDTESTSIPTITQSPSLTPNPSTTDVAAGKSSSPTPSQISGGGVQVSQTNITPTLQSKKIPDTSIMTNKSFFILIGVSLLLTGTGLYLYSRKQRSNLSLSVDKTDD